VAAGHHSNSNSNNEAKSDESKNDKLFLSLVGHKLQQGPGLAQPWIDAQGTPQIHLNDMIHIPGAAV